ncbi:MAG: threonine/serine dehydratase [Gemmatimonadota bacterium]
MSASRGEPARPRDVRRAAQLVGLEAIREAAERIRGVALRTPLLPAPVPTAGEPAAISAGRGPRRPTAEAARLWLKCESFQPVGAFKLRGAYNFIASLDADTRESGVLTFSSGNHARAVAYAARRLGIPASVVMPVDAPRVKLEATRALGAHVEQVGTTTVERQRRAEELQRERGGTMVPPFDHPAIIAGQGTVGLEIVRQMAAPEGDPALVLVPVGGGGLISGVAAALRALVPGVRIVGVEPVGAAKMSRSLAEGRPVSLEQIDTIADGLKPARPGDLTFAHCRALVDEVVTVSDDALRAGVLWCFRQRLVVEPSGAAGVAALLTGRVRPAPSREGATVVVLSGGNIDPGLLCGWLTS